MTAVRRLAAPAPGSPAAELAAARVAGRRLRPYRPVRALAGALLVLAAVVAALALYTRLGDRTDVLALARNVLAGEVISPGDLRVVSIATDDDIPTVAASERAMVIGQYARVRLAAGSLLVRDGFQPGPLVDPSRVLMSIEVPAGQVPFGLREQSRLVLVVTPSRATGGDQAPPILVEATVAAVPGNLAEAIGGGGGGGATLALSVEVPADAVTAVGTADSIGLGVLDPSAPFPVSAPPPPTEVAAS